MYSLHDYSTILRKIARRYLQRPRAVYKQHDCVASLRIHPKILWRGAAPSPKLLGGGRPPPLPPPPPRAAATARRLIELTAGGKISYCGDTCDTFFFHFITRPGLTKTCHEVAARVAARGLTNYSKLNTQWHWLGATSRWEACACKLNVIAVGTICCWCRQCLWLWGMRVVHAHLFLYLI